LTPAATSNTALGTGADFTNEIPSGNTAVGFYALLNNIAGSSNVAVGVDGLHSNTADTNNTANAGNPAAGLTLSAQCFREIDQLPRLFETRNQVIFL
jgi:hypothetical protein